MTFPCTACGACCRQLPAGSPMALEDGTCRHLDIRTHHCSIYSERPLVCRVDEVYERRVAGHASARVFYLLQAQVCASLDARNSALPRLVAEALMSPPSNNAPSMHEQRLQDFMTLEPDELQEGLRHILGVARSLIAETSEERPVIAAPDCGSDSGRH
ncbi:Fe-S-cluster containining protein [Roseateles sp. YR242]|uniref:YkgJ family cysteine cluster protein n=1 Tax=Roseateles sp. YR242 TaxID=1855305 RepID=UPI0008AB53B1|nr:YkgJ family cysteine cluster protein [Roseateles sp. YR242]SEK63680.1 Fe-S-cluster containining protein [Roseateles sp. YR242]